MKTIYEEPTIEIPIIKKNGVRIRSDLEDTRDSFHETSKRYKKHECLFKIIDKIMTYPQLILSIAITSLSGLETYSSRSEASYITKIIFILGLTNSILSASTTFFNFSAKMISYNLLSCQYENIYISLKAWLLLTRDRDELKNKLQEIKTTEIIISDHDLSLCF